MKKRYPNYLGRMKEIEEKISIQDKEVLENYKKFCALSSGKEKTEQRLRYALQFLDIAETSYHEFNKDIIENIYNLIKETSREVGGKNEVIKQLKFFIIWLKDDPSLIKNLKTLQQRKGFNTQKLNPNSLITPEEIEALIRACENNPKKIAMITLQTELGLRPHELLNLKWSDINFNDNETGEIKIYASKTRDTRILPFINSMHALINWKKFYHYPEPKNNDLIFPHPLIRQQKLYRTYLSQLYLALCKKAGIRHIYPYLARHTKLTEINKKLPSKVASAYGGHSEKTACIYTHLNDADIREIVLKELYKQKEVSPQDKRKISDLRQEIDRLKFEGLEFKKMLITLKQEISKIKDL